VSPSLASISSTRPAVKSRAPRTRRLNTGKIPRRSRCPPLLPASRGLTPLPDYIFSKVT
jgi:hypothetical protein